MSLFGIGRRYYRPFRRSFLRSSNRRNRFMATVDNKSRRWHYRNLTRDLRRGYFYGGK